MSQSNISADFNDLRGLASARNRAQVGVLFTMVGAPVGGVVGTGVGVAVGAELGRGVGVEVGNALGEALGACGREERVAYSTH
jgi:hypothetical protein